MVQQDITFPDRPENVFSAVEVAQAGMDHGQERRVLEVGPVDLYQAH